MTPRLAGCDYTRNEAARALRLSVRQLELATAAGEIQCQRYGRRVTYTREQLAAYRLLHQQPLKPAVAKRLAAIVKRQLEVMETFA